MRIAFFGPLPPSNTGIADYDQALLPLLRQDYVVDVFLEHTSPLNEGFSHADFFSMQDRQPYDLTIYQLGNSPFHEYMYGYLFQNPGAVVFHDSCLLHSRSEMLLKRQMTQEYRDELNAVYPEQAEEIANAVIPSAAGDLLFYQFPLFELILRSSLAAGAHTDFAAKQLSLSDTPVLKIPHLELPGALVDKSELLPGKFVIASFGYATTAKRVPVLLEVIAEIRMQRPEVFCLIVGEVEDRAGLQRQIDALSLQDEVIVTGHVEMKDFLGWMGRSDTIVNLRYPSAGEMSGTLIRALASQKPVLISRLQGLHEIPEDAVLRVRPDQEKTDLKNALLALINDRSLRERLSTNARKYIRQRHSPEQVCAQYGKLIHAAVERKRNFHGIKLPAHLKSGKDILRDYLQAGVLRGAPAAMEWLPNS
jgi:glycosyltransferase involved in cell wall biosynthesis